LGQSKTLLHGRKNKELKKKMGRTQKQPRSNLSNEERGEKEGGSKEPYPENYRQFLTVKVKIKKRSTKKEMGK